MPNYVLAQESNRANIPDRLWYAMEETDLEDIAANENIATGDKVYVIKQGKTYIFGEDSEWYVSGKSSGGGGTSVDVEPLAVNANGTYTAAEGTAYSPVTVDVPQTAVESLAVAANGTYTAQAGKAYSPVTVEVTPNLGKIADRTVTSILAEELAGIFSIGSYAFYSCQQLTSVVLPSSVTALGRSAFEACVALSSINLDGVTLIEADCFVACSALTNITLSNNITLIGNSAFEVCTNLTSVTVPATTPPTLGSMAFNSTSANLVIYVPSASVATYQAASGWSTYADRIQAIPS